MSNALWTTLVRLWIHSFLSCLFVYPELTYDVFEVLLWSFVCKSYRDGTNECLHLAGEPNRGRTRCKTAARLWGNAEVVCWARIHIHKILVRQWTLQCWILSCWGTSASGGHMKGNTSASGVHMNRIHQLQEDEWEEGSSMQLAEMMTIAMLAISLPEDWVDLLCTGGL
jgi:hypothetical protein